MALRSSFCFARKGIRHFATVLKNVNNMNVTFLRLRAYKTLNILQKVKDIPRFQIAIGTGLAGFSRCFFGLGKREDENELKRLFREAKLAQIKREYSTAEDLYHDALQAADDLLREEELTQKDYLYAKTNIYDSLADMALTRGDFAGAEKLYKATIKGCLDLGIVKEDNAIVEISIKLATIYAMLRRNDEAEKGYQHCIQCQEKKVQSNPDATVDTKALLGMALESYGRFLLLHSRLEEAYPLFERAIDIAQATLGKDHSQTLILMNDLATVNILKQDYSRAEKTLKDAILIGQEKNVPEVSILYCNLGSLYLRQTNLVQAEDSCQESLRLSLKARDVLTERQAKACLEKIRKVRNQKKCESTDA